MEAGSYSSNSVEIEAVWKKLEAMDILRSKSLHQF